MNAMQIADASKPTTIGELKQYLADLEAAWGEQEEQYLGTFDEQTLHMAAPDQGVGAGYAQYHAGFGLMIVEN